MELESNTHWAITALFELVGIQYAKDGPKAPPFSGLFKMLGLMVNLEQVPNLCFLVGHTGERREELKGCWRTLFPPVKFRRKTLNV